MHKKGSGKELFGMKNWKKRYFVLKNGELKYFESLDSKTGKPISEKGYFPITGGNVFKTTETGRSFSFAVQQSDQILHLSADSSDELSKWMDAIQAMASDGEKMNVVITRSSETGAQPSGNESSGTISKPIATTSASRESDTKADQSIQKVDGEAPENETISNLVSKNLIAKPIPIPVAIVNSVDMVTSFPTSPDTMAEVSVHERNAPDEVLNKSDSIAVDEKINWATAVFETYEVNREPKAEMPTPVDVLQKQIKSVSFQDSKVALASSIERTERSPSLSTAHCETHTVSHDAADNEPAFIQDSMPTYKLLLVGKAQSGKTALARSVSGEDFDDDYVGMWLA